MSSSALPQWRDGEPLERLKGLKAMLPNLQWTFQDGAHSGFAEVTVAGASPAEAGWFRVRINDHTDPHGAPVAHDDFMTLYVYKKIESKARRKALVDISDSISYDATAYILAVKCHFMGANVATAGLVFNYLDRRAVEDVPSQVEYKRYIEATRAQGAVGREVYELYLQIIGLGQWIQKDSAGRLTTGTLWDGFAAGT